MPPSDDQLRSGDVLDIEDLLKHEDWLRGFVRRLVADPGAAADVVQDTWLRALRKPAPVRRAKGFLARIAYNLAISRRRSSTIRSRHERAAAKAEALESAAETVERLEAQRVVTRAIAVLPDAERTAVVLRHIHGMAPDEIAARLELTPAAVRQRCHRGLERVRSRIRGELGDDWRTHPGVAALMGLPLHAAATATSGAAFASEGSRAAILSSLTSTLLMTMKTKAAVGSTAAIAAVMLGALLWGLDVLSPVGVEPPSTDRLAAATAQGEGRLSGAERSSTSMAPERSEVVPERRAGAADGSSIELLEAPTMLRLEVHDVTGTPIPGCAVRHVPGHAQPPNRRSSVLLMADSFVELGTTGEHGEVMVPVPSRSGFVDVRHPDPHRDWKLVHSVRIGGTATKNVAMTRRVVLTPAVAVRGLVQPRAGGPLSRRVRVEETVRELTEFPLPLEDSFRIAGDVLEVRPDGTFAFESLPSTASVLVFSAQRADGVFYEFHRHPVGDCDEYVVVPLTTDSDAATPPVPVIGRVVAPNGDAIPRAKVEITTQDGTQRIADWTDETGRFSMHAVRDAGARRILVVSSVGWRPRRIDDLEARLGSAAVLGAPAMIDIRLERGLDLTGRVLESNGVPVAGLRVLPASASAFPGGRSADDLHGGGPDALRIDGDRIATQAVTTDDGSFSLRGLADAPLRLRVLNLDTGFGWTSGELRPGPAPVVLRLPAERMRAHIAGRVVDRLGRGIARAEIALSTHVRSVGIVQHWRGRKLGLTGEDGSFSFVDVPRYELRLTASGTGLISRNFDVLPNAPGDGLEIVVARRCFVRAAFSATSAVASFAIVDRDGARLDLAVKSSGRTASRTEHRVTDGQSSPVAVSDVAIAALLFDAAGRQIGRLPVRLVPDRVFELHN